MKKYIVPAVSTLDFKIESPLCAVSSGPKVYGQEVSGEGEGIGEQFTQEKGGWSQNDWQ